MRSVLTIGIAVADDIYAIPGRLVPGEKHRAHTRLHVVGGTAANAALAIARLGGEARLITRFGDDRAGLLLRQELETKGVDLSLSGICPGRMTSTSTIVIEPGGDRTVINILDRSLPDAPDWMPRHLPAGISAVLSDVRWETAGLALFAEARAAGLPCILDGDRQPANRALIAQATHAVFSAQGLRETTGCDTPERGLAALAGEVEGFVAVTEGAAGILAWIDGAPRRFPAFRVNAVDSLGAGDVWHGAFALALAEGQPVPAAIRFASGAAALKCTRLGGATGTPTRAELDRFLKENSP